MESVTTIQRKTWLTLKTYLLAAATCTCTYMYNIFIACIGQPSYSSALERQQLEADVRELTKEKKDLLDQLEDYKDDLKAKDDCEIVTVYIGYTWFIFTNCLLFIHCSLSMSVLIMREKVISASLSQHHKRMEIIPERNKSCSNVGVQTVPQDEQGHLPVR